MPVPWWRAWPMLGGLALLAATVGAILLGAAQGNLHPALFFGLAIALIAIFGFLMESADRKARSKPLDISLDADWLSFGSQRVRRSTIRSAFVVPGRRGPDALRLERGFRRDLTLIFDRPEDGDALSSALGMDPFQQALQVQTPTGLGAALRRGLWFLALPFLAPLILRDTSRSAATIATLFWIATIVALVPHRYRIGRDGISDVWLWRRRFVPAADILDVKATERTVGPSNSRRREHHVEVTVRNGPTLDITCMDEERALAVCERVRRVLRAQRVEETTHRLDTQLARGERTADEWLRHLRRIAAGEANDYRSQAVTREDLVRTIQDPAQAPGVRVAAAVAVVESASADERQAIAAAARASANEQVRVSLTKLLDERGDKELEALVDENSETALERRDN